MSEKIRLSHESKYFADIPKTQETARNTSEHEVKKTVHEHKKNIEKITKTVETSAVTSEELKKKTATEQPAKTSGKYKVSKELRKNSLNQSLKSVRKELNFYQKPLSRIVHNDAVEAISEISEKTIARPSGLLFGGIASFATSLVVLIVCRYYGYEYNYLVGLISFPVGFAAGLILEFITKPLRRRSS